MRHGRKHILLMLFFLFPLTASAQKTRTVSGDYTYYAPSDVTLDQARQTALSRAKQQLIAETFGTVMQVNSSTSVSNSDGVSSINYMSAGASEVKGEWVETIGEPRYDIRYEQQMLVVTVSVKGRVREMLGARAGFRVSVLKNGTESKFEADEFRDGDDLFLSFRSPDDGYLMIYLYDGAQEVCRLLPYAGQKTDFQRIEAGKRYIFFSSGDADYGIPSSSIDEYVMTCRGKSEINRIYVIFSPEPFLGAPADGSDSGIIGYPSFQKWVADSRVRDGKIQIDIKDILIRK